MNRRDFIKVSCSGTMTLFLSGCGLGALKSSGTQAPKLNTEGREKI